MKKTRRLRTRHWLARLDRRMRRALKHREQGWQGDHRRWWEEGRQSIMGEGVEGECPW